MVFMNIPGDIISGITVKIVPEREVLSLKVNVKVIIFILVVLAVGAIFVIPYLTTEEGKTGEFATTPQPAAKLQQAVDKGKPVFLEFYAVT